VRSFAGTDAVKADLKKGFRSGIACDGAHDALEEDFRRKVSTSLNQPIEPKRYSLKALARSFQIM
jgi:hypothetical protein